MTLPATRPELAPCATTGWPIKSSPLVMSPVSTIGPISPMP
ncbi:Uncharacterised protein [Mycobacteroides abscessus subsp. abscessus]|nr:Uncharacterised protein [Mycobacteroides abscessus subsp. abscessus]SHX91886.1 Uncharacterised protein [Mycobacteroides abscessus subsp. abscessus]SKS87161.1 Uncharacterised protein [Mycobacteroides abscessus subsp. abscessus]SKV31883.1 Uncharacterised protein [Mycobacteroides abscessus subsp. abscessus]